jgi:hypothetical protein
MFFEFVRAIEEWSPEAERLRYLKVHRLGTRDTELRAPIPGHHRSILFQLYNSQHVSSFVGRVINNDFPLCILLASPN